MYSLCVRSTYALLIQRTKPDNICIPFWWWMVTYLWIQANNKLLPGCCCCCCSIMRLSPKKIVVLWQFKTVGFSMNCFLLELYCWFSAILQIFFLQDNHDFVFYLTTLGCLECLVTMHYWFSILSHNFCYYHCWKKCQKHLWNCQRLSVLTIKIPKFRKFTPIGWPIWLRLRYTRYI